MSNWTTTVPLTFPEYDSPLVKGDEVWVYKQRAPFAMGVVDSWDEDMKRYLVIYQDGSSYHVKRSRLIKVHTRGLIVCADTDQYRRLAFTQTAAWQNGQIQTKGCSVLEIGCAEGDCTMAFLHAKCKDLIAVDKSETCVEITTKKVTEAVQAKPHLEDANIQVKLMDIFSSVDWTECVHFSAGKTVVVFVDINGNRELPAVIKALHVIEERLPSCELVIVKSSLLEKELRQDPARFEELFKMRHE
eukprot:TRINITY_DN17461_c0_g1_i2.p1 TRINITY_DN17461_c0_g1~~TRINITY_DN17461_c0_g1_i2.p1  ORF type:complete len:245 (+),score=61.08 TRINITY_DN17461_c0_g1_i2:105-839(+)